MMTLAQATTIRQAAEADYKALPTIKNLRRLWAASNREMGIYLKGFDARNPR